MVVDLYVAFWLEVMSFVSSSLSPLLQILDPAARLGCDQMGGYQPMKDHIFFEGTEWESVSQQQPPKLMPYLPSTSKGQLGLRSDVNVRAEVNKRARVAAG